jgi:hypothetical protein
MDSETAHSDGDVPEPQELAALQRAVQANGKALNAIASSPAAVWLAAQLDSEEGTHEVLDRLQAAVDAPAFVDKLDAAAVADNGGSSFALPALVGGLDVTRRSFWTWRRSDRNDSAALAEALLSERAAGECKRADADGGTSASSESSYVLVSHDDVIDALAEFIARLLIAHPESLQLTHKQLQCALSDAVKVVRRSRMRRMWDWGRSLNRWGLWLYGASSIAANPALPWVLRAVGYGLWTAGRCAVGLVY